MAEITTAGAAEILGLTERQVRRLAKKGNLPARRIGRDYLFDPVAVRRFDKIPRKRGPKPGTVRT